MKLHIMPDGSIFNLECIMKITPPKVDDKGAYVLIYDITSRCTSYAFDQKLDADKFIESIVYCAGGLA